MSNDSNRISKEDLATLLEKAKRTSLREARKNILKLFGKSSDIVAEAS